MITYSRTFWLYHGKIHKPDIAFNVQKRLIINMDSKFSESDMYPHRKEYGIHFNFMFSFEKKYWFSGNFWHRLKRTLLLKNTSRTMYLKNDIWKVGLCLGWVVNESVGPLIINANAMMYNQINAPLNGLNNTY